jgi:solute carrier family 25 aspartate/glutamate transporter 12/13
MVDFFQSVYNFGLGGIAGGIGAFVVYPIDLVKTRSVGYRLLRYTGRILLLTQ